MASEQETVTNDARLPSSWATGITIGSASILTMVFMAFHPVAHAHSREEFLAEMNRIELVNRLVHGSIIALLGMLVVGYGCLTARLGRSSVLARTGLIAYIMGAIAMSAAALINGIVLSDYLSQYEGKSNEKIEIAIQVIGYGTVVNQNCSKLGVLAMSVALLCWSISLIRRPGNLHGVGIFGCLAGAVPGIALLMGYLHMGFHGMLAFVLCQMLWGLAVAWQLVRGKL